MKAYMVRVAVAVAALVTTSAALAHDDGWVWTEQHAADSLVSGGITWDTLGRHDAVLKDHCTGFGDSQTLPGGRAYVHFYCEVRPKRGSRYAVVLHATGRDDYRVSFDRFSTTRTWYWPAQRAAEALVANGITWPGRHDAVVSDTCSAFGARLAAGRPLYQHFFCHVRPERDRPYQVLVHVDTRSRYSVTWLGYESQAPVAQGQGPTYGWSRAYGDAILAQGLRQMTYFTNQMRYGADFPPTCATAAWVC